MARRVTAAALVALALLAGAAGADDDKPWPGPPACSAVSERIPVPPRGAARRGVRVWVQCNFAVDHLTIKGNRELSRVGARPRLYRADQGDALACSKRAPRRVGCRGAVGQDARIAVRLVLAKPVCTGAHPRFGVSVRGGIDCDDGQACPAIGYLYKISTGPLTC
jgi:hypothetical protein